MSRRNQDYLHYDVHCDVHSGDRKKEKFVSIYDTTLRDGAQSVGVSDNIIDASWLALTDALIYKLKKDEEDKKNMEVTL